MKKFRILSLDGGGLRGIVPLTVLKKIEELTGRRIHESFDMIAGTSTGGLIACALTLSLDGVNPLYTLDQIADVYLHRGSEIFPQHTGIQNWIDEARSVLKPRFTGTGIDKVFRDVLQHYRMSQALNHLLISSYDLNNNCPLFFKSHVSKENAGNPVKDLEMYQVCRATSAGPSYLPAFLLNYENNPGIEKTERICIDGGVYVNNPSMAALSELSNHFKDKYGYPPELNDIDYEDVYVLSLGTGHFQGQLAGSGKSDKGEIFWAQNISDVMMYGVNSTTDYEMKEMMITGNYLRFTITIDSEKHAEITNTSPDTAQYLIDQTNRQVLNDGNKMTALKNFLNKSLDMMPLLV